MKRLSITSALFHMAFKVATTKLKCLNLQPILILASIEDSVIIFLITNSIEWLQQGKSDSVTGGALT